MNELPEVAVICCFLNGKEYLGEAIDAVLAQDYGNFTLTLVDDGSTDGATELARAYAAKDERVRYYEHENHANKGLSASRNAGIAATKAPLVAFIDADDHWTSTKLTDQVAIMQAHPEVGMVCGGTCYWSSWSGGEDAFIASGPRQDVVCLPPDTLLEMYPLGKGDAPPPSDLLVRRRALERVGGFESHFQSIYGLYEDQAFLSKIYLLEPVYFSSRYWLWYRQHPKSLMATVIADGRYHEVRRYYLEWFSGYVAGKPETDSRVKKAIAKARLPYRIPGWGFWLKQRPDKAVLRIGRKFAKRVKRLVAPAD
jgi:glycosyltransferase involved in cell wall biosynthesis